MKELYACLSANHTAGRERVPLRNGALLWYRQRAAMFHSPSPHLSYFLKCSQTFRAVGQDMCLLSAFCLRRQVSSGVPAPTAVPWGSVPARCLCCSALGAAKSCLMGQCALGVAPGSPALSGYPLDAVSALQPKVGWKPLPGGASGRLRDQVKAELERVQALAAKCLDINKAQVITLCHLPLSWPTTGEIHHLHTLGALTRHGGKQRTPSHAFCAQVVSFLWSARQQIHQISWSDLQSGHCRHSYI